VKDGSIGKRRAVPAPLTAPGRRASMLDVAERRLVRLGLDLHDGPVQDVAALTADVRLLLDHLDGALPPVALQSLADVAARLDGLHSELRDLAFSLESRTLVERPLGDVLAEEARSFRERSSIELSLDVHGDVDDLTASQRIAAARIIQESLSNIRDHSRARQAWVRVLAGEDVVRITIEDDGRGFDVAHARRAARRRGRLGLLGMEERVRLLQGSFSITTSPGSPTEIVVDLPRWRPTGDGSVPKPRGRDASRG
jgi:two-component system, NarL family, sensor histidine kinase DegS